MTVPKHGHVVGPVTVHPPLRQLGAAEEVTAADDHRDLRAGPDHVSQLSGDRLDDAWVDADSAAAENLAGQFQHDPPVLARWYEHCGVAERQVGVEAAIGCGLHPRWY